MRISRPKDGANYTAEVRAHVQHRTRLHETTVRLAGEWLQDRGLVAETPNWIDLLSRTPEPVIVEVTIWVSPWPGGTETRYTVVTAPASRWIYLWMVERMRSPLTVGKPIAERDDLHGALVVIAKRLESAAPTTASLSPML